MTVTRQLLDSHPADLGEIDPEALAAAIDATVRCAQVCTACADACLGEETVDQLRSCIRGDLDCADVCSTTSRVLSRHTGYDANLTRAVLEACITACAACAEDCGSHAEMHDHCRICAETCRGCEQACQGLLDTLG